MYNPEYTKRFYDAYGAAEWSRLENTAYGRLQAIIHADFIRKYIKSGDRVLDAGSGPGRFSIVLAQLGAKVTVLDISPQQLALAHQKLAEANLLDHVEEFVQADIADLSMFSDRVFDAVICFGGALSYVCEGRQRAAAELVRVTRTGSTLLVSVMSRLGAILLAVQQPHMPTLVQPNVAEPDRPGLWDALENGTYPGFPSKTTGTLHPSMHLYTANELESLFRACQLIEIAGSNVAARERFSPSLEQIASNPEAWSTLVELERRINTDRGLVNSGTHIILAAKKQADRP